MTFAKGLEGLARNDADVLQLARTLQRKYTLDSSEASQEFFYNLWQGQSDMRASVPTALDTSKPYRLPLDTALYISIRPPVDGALTFIHLGSDDVATLVYPSPANTTLGVLGQRSVTVGDELSMYSSEPLGKEWILLVLTADPLIPPNIPGVQQVEDWARAYTFGGDNSPAEQLLRWLVDALEEGPLAAAVVPIEVVRMQRRES
jgi:hypothetical protein